MGKPYLKKRKVIPIYNAKLWLVVCDNVKDERVKLNRVLGTFDLIGEFDGLCSSNFNCFALFFEKKRLEKGALNLVAHECFHLTHRIIEWAGANFDEDNHEHGAILHGYLTDLVHSEVGKFGKVQA